MRVLLLCDDRDFFLEARVAHIDAHQEPVQLRLGQREGALVLDRVLGGDDQERQRQRVRYAVHRDLALFHGLQQRRLGLGRGPVDLVGQHQLGRDGTGPEGELTGGLVVH